MINGKRYLFKGLSKTDGEKLGIYFDELSLESRMRFGPHPLNSQFALLLCQELEYDYFISRFIIENVEDMSIEGYFILDFNLSPHEKNRYKYFKTEENVDGIELKAFKDVLFAPSIADKSQNSGLASAVMPFIIDYAKAKNVRNIVLMGGTQETNQRAIRFYEKFNFKRVGGYMTDIYNYDMLLSI